MKDAFQTDLPAGWGWRIDAESWRDEENAVTRFSTLNAGPGAGRF